MLFVLSKLLHIGIDLSIPQQINFVGKLEEHDGATMLLLLRSSKKLF